jgi:hypothetical protein
VFGVRYIPDTEHRAIAEAWAAKLPVMSPSC